MDAETQAVLETLARQRNAALDEIARQNGYIATLEARIKELEQKASTDGDGGKG